MSYAVYPLSEILDRNVLTKVQNFENQSKNITLSPAFEYGSRLNFLKLPRSQGSPLPVPTERERGWERGCF